MYAERWEKGFQDDCGMDADAFVENALQEIYPPQGPLLDGCCRCTGNKTKNITFFANIEAAIFSKY